MDGAQQRVCTSIGGATVLWLGRALADAFVTPAVQARLLISGSRNGRARGPIQAAPLWRSVRTRVSPCFTCDIHRPLTGLADQRFASTDYKLIFRLHRRLELARTLTSCFISVLERHQLKLGPLVRADHVQAGPKTPLVVADLHSMPSRVRAHYVKLLLDWTVSALTKSSPKASLAADSQAFLQLLSSKWELLFVLLTSVDSPAQAAPNVTLSAAAAAACKGSSWQQASSEEGAKLALALQQTVLALNIKFKHSFRPSLEHR